MTEPTRLTASDIVRATEALKGQGFEAIIDKVMAELGQNLARWIDIQIRMKLWRPLAPKWAIYKCFDSKGEAL